METLLSYYFNKCFPILAFSGTDIRKKWQYLLSFIATIHDVVELHPAFPEVNNVQFNQDEKKKEAKTNDLLIPESDTEIAENDPELPECSVCLYKFIYSGVRNRRRVE